MEDCRYIREPKKYHNTKDYETIFQFIDFLIIISNPSCC